MKKLLILGAMEMHVPLIKRAKEILAKVESENPRESFG